MKALITGITGFVGSHLAGHLLEQGVEVEGITHYPASRGFPKPNLAGLEDRITLHHEVLIHERDNVESFFDNSKYDYIFHLASERFIASSTWILNINVRGTANLLEAVRNSGQHPVIVIAGCGDMYGIPQIVPEGISYKPGSGYRTGISRAQPLKFRLPITEDCPLNPVSAYAVSKAAQDMLGFQYHKEYGMKIVRTRIFDITGPRSHQSLPPSKLARQMAEIEKGMHEPEIRIANPDYERDYTDVRDVARALWLAATKCGYEEPYNICSGRGRTVQQVIDILRMQSTAQFEVVQDMTLMRPNDIIASVGDCGKFYKRTGWKPEIGFAKSMGDLLDYWRKRLEMEQI